MSDIFREVDEELRQERYARLWKKYGRYLIALAVLLVLVVAGYQGWQQYRASVRQAESDRFAAAARVAGEQDALTRFEALAAESWTGYGLLARFRAANLRLDTGDRTGGIAAYEAIAADDDVAPLYRELAVLMIGFHTLEQADADDLRARLQPLAEAGAPWRHTARGLLAALALHRGDTDSAATLYRQLADDGEAPQGLRSRAAEMLRTIGEDG